MKYTKKNNKKKTLSNHSFLTSKNKNKLFVYEANGGKDINFRKNNIIKKKIKKTKTSLPLTTLQRFNKYGIYDIYTQNGGFISKLKFNYKIKKIKAIIKKLGKYEIKLHKFFDSYEIEAKKFKNLADDKSELLNDRLRSKKIEIIYTFVVENMVNENDFKTSNFEDDLKMIKNKYIAVEKKLIQLDKEIKKEKKNYEGFFKRFKSQMILFDKVIKSFAKIQDFYTEQKYLKDNYILIQDKTKLSKFDKQIKQKYLDNKTGIDFILSYGDKNIEKDKKDRDNINTILDKSKTYKDAYFKLDDDDNKNKYQKNITEWETKYKQIYQDIIGIDKKISNIQKIFYKLNEYVEIIKRELNIIYKSINKANQLDSIIKILQIFEKNDKILNIAKDLIKNIKVALIQENEINDIISITSYVEAAFKTIENNLIDLNINLLEDKKLLTKDIGSPKKLKGGVLNKYLDEYDTFENFLEGEYNNIIDILQTINNELKDKDKTKNIYNLESNKVHTIIKKYFNIYLFFLYYLKNRENNNKLEEINNNINFDLDNDNTLIIKWFNNINNIYKDIYKDKDNKNKNYTNLEYKYKNRLNKYNSPENIDKLTKFNNKIKNIIDDYFIKIKDSYHSIDNNDKKIKNLYYTLNKDINKGIFKNKFKIFSGYKNLNLANDISVDTTTENFFNKNFINYKNNIMKENYLLYKDKNDDEYQLYTVLYHNENDLYKNIKKDKKFSSIKTKYKDFENNIITNYNKIKKLNTDQEDKIKKNLNEANEHITKDTEGINHNNEKLNKLIKTNFVITLNNFLKKENEVDETDNTDNTDSIKVLKNKIIKDNWNDFIKDKPVKSISVKNFNKLLNNIEIGTTNKDTTFLANLNTLFTDNNNFNQDALNVVKELINGKAAVTGWWGWSDAIDPITDIVALKTKLNKIKTEIETGSSSTTYRFQANDINEILEHITYYKNIIDGEHNDIINTFPEDKTKTKKIIKFMNKSDDLNHLQYNLIQLYCGKKDSIILDTPPDIDINDDFQTFLKKYIYPEILLNFYNNTDINKEIKNKINLKIIKNNDDYLILHKEIETEISKLQTEQKFIDDIHIWLQYYNKNSKILYIDNVSQCIENITNSDKLYDKLYDNDTFELDHNKFVNLCNTNFKLELKKIQKEVETEIEIETEKKETNKNQDIIIFNTFIEKKEEYRYKNTNIRGAIIDDNETKLYEKIIAGDTNSTNFKKYKHTNTPKKDNKTNRIVCFNVHRWISIDKYNNEYTNPESVINFLKNINIDSNILCLLDYTLHDEKNNTGSSSLSGVSSRGGFFIYDNKNKQIQYGGTEALSPITVSNNNVKDQIEKKLNLEMKCITNNNYNQKIIDKEIFLGKGLYLQNELKNTNNDKHIIYENDKDQEIILYIDYKLNNNNIRIYFVNYNNSNNILSKNKKLMEKIISDNNNIYIIMGNFSCDLSKNADDFEIFTKNNLIKIGNKNITFVNGEEYDLCYVSKEFNKLYDILNKDNIIIQSGGISTHYPIYIDIVEKKEKIKTNNVNSFNLYNDNDKNNNKNETVNEIKPFLTTFLKHTEGIKNIDKNKQNLLDRISEMTNKMKTDLKPEIYKDITNNINIIAQTQIELKLIEKELKPYSVKEYNKVITEYKWLNNVVKSEKDKIDLQSSTKELKDLISSTPKINKLSNISITDNEILEIILLSKDKKLTRVNISEDNHKLLNKLISNDNNMNKLLKILEVKGTQTKCEVLQFLNINSYNGDLLINEYYNNDNKCLEILKKKSEEKNKKKTEEYKKFMKN